MGAYCYPGKASAQSLLDKTVELKAETLPLGRLLQEMSRQGGFQFSYHSRVLAEDSLVQAPAGGVTVREVLDSLFRPPLEYLEAGDYIIIRLQGRPLALSLENIRRRGNSYWVSGYVRDLRSGRGIADASVYERQLLLATLTDDRGHFRLRVRDRYKTIALTASKALHEDTTIFIQLEGIVVLPGGAGPGSPDASLYGPGGGEAVERTRLGRFLVSSSQRIQSLNLREFFTESPVQASLTPGLSSQGRMSAQVVNKFSVNLIGGYTAGVDGVEMAGLFNINRKSVQHLQLAGAFSVVGGSVSGVQISGLHNIVLGRVGGVQAAGAYNHVKDDHSGVQLAGAVNRVEGETRGLQLSSGLNYAGHLRGVQIGVVNIADSSSGTSIGLVNIIKKNGYLNLSLSANESFPVNLAFKSGTRRFYAILQGGLLPGGEKLYAYGAGIGSRMGLSGRLFVQPELLFQQVYQGDSESDNHLYRANLELHYPLNRSIGLFGGPSFNLWKSDQYEARPGYGLLSENRQGSFSIGQKGIRGWIGWSLGLSFF